MEKKNSKSKAAQKGIKGVKPKLSAEEKKRSEEAFLARLGEMSKEITRQWNKASNRDA